APCHILPAQRAGQDLAEERVRHPVAQTVAQREELVRKLIELAIIKLLDAVVSHISDLQQEMAEQLALDVQVPLLTVGCSVTQIDENGRLAEQRAGSQPAAGGLIESLRVRIAQEVRRRAAAVDEAGRGRKSAHPDTRCSRGRNARRIEESESAADH